MKFVSTSIAGVYLIEIERRADERGFFARTWCERELAEHGLSTRIAQVNTSTSLKAGTLRGMHYQAAPFAEVKIVRCFRGAAYDVVIDLRPQSKTFMRWTGAELTAENGTMIYAPEGCAHGYLTLREDTEVSYSTSEFYSPDAVRGVCYDDPAFDIYWPSEVHVVSEQDRSWPKFKR